MYKLYAIKNSCYQRCACDGNCFRHARDGETKRGGGGERKEKEERRLVRRWR